ncbi:MAG: DUF4912 domain-containing protein [Elusimicrobiales bacterium]
MTNPTALAASNDKVYLLPRNPAAAFVCWTWSRSRSDAFEAGVYEREILVRLFVVDDKALAVEAAAAWDAGKLYLKPPVEGRTYTAAVFARKNDGSQEKLMESNAAAVPVSAPRQDLSAGYSSAEFFRKEPAQP